MIAVVASALRIEGAGKRCGKRRRRHRHRRQHDDLVSATRETLGAGLCHRFRDHDVGAQRQVWTVRLDRAQREHGDDLPQSSASKAGQVIARRWWTAIRG